MPSNFTLEDPYESYVQAQLASGRFKSPGEVVQAALQLMEQRDRDLNTLDAAMKTGLEDIAHGRLHAADTVFDELEARYDRMAKEHA